MEDNSDCIFCKIVKKKIPANIVYENKDVLAFLDAFPCVKGQALIIPKKHVGYFIDMNDKDYQKLMLSAKKISKATQKTFNPVKVGLIIEGLEVNHVHVRIYPLDKGGFAKVLKCKPSISDEEMKNIAEKIKNNL